MKRVEGVAARVLVIDDDSQILDVVSLMLDTAGYLTLAAIDGKEGLRLAIDAMPELILLDVHMPGMDGFEVAAALLKHPKARNIPIVMMTGLRGADDRLKSLEAGAVDFLVKPLSADELIAKVGSLVRLKAYHDDAESRREELLAEVAGKSEQLVSALEAFSRFVPSEFLELLSKKSILDVSLGDQVQKDMTILFADIRAFTALSEKMTPKDNFSFMNSYLGRMNPFIWENGGYIDKYIGDAIMALFQSGPSSALDAAIAMLRHMPVYNLHRSLFGFEPISIGIGINTGPVMLGIIGHERFMQGTVISDAVNLASRLEALTKEYEVSLVISKYVLFGLADPNRYHFRFLDKVKLKGKTELIPVYEVFDADPPALLEQKTATSESFERAAYEYHAGRFKVAIDLFESIPRGNVRDAPIDIYHERCIKALREEKG